MLFRDATSKRSKVQRMILKNKTLDLSCLSLTRPSMTSAVKTLWYIEVVTVSLLEWKNSNRRREEISSIFCPIWRRCIERGKENQRKTARRFRLIPWSSCKKTITISSCESLAKEDLLKEWQSVYEWVFSSSSRSDLVLFILFRFFSISYSLLSCLPSLKYILSPHEITGNYFSITRKDSHKERPTEARLEKRVCFPWMFCMESVLVVTFRV